MPHGSGFCLVAILEVWPGMPAYSVSLATLVYPVMIERTVGRLVSMGVALHVCSTDLAVGLIPD